MINGRILAADDARVMRTVISRKLEEQGHTVTAVTSGAEVLAQADAAIFDLVLLDINMPDMDGVEALRQLRLRFDPTTLPVIMATASDDNDAIVQAFELGANDFVTKPINFPVLLARIETHLKLKQTVEELKRLTNSTPEA